MALLFDLSGEPLVSALKRLSAPPKISETIQRVLQNAYPLLSVVGHDDPIMNYRALSGLTVENALLLMAMAKEEKKKRAISKYFTEERYVKPFVDGKVLKRLGIPPGPVYSVIMRDVLEQKILGRLASVEDEIAYVKEKYCSAPAGGQVATGKWQIEG
jgi:tRNA nucleotidyltransferase (CCA-adding enzyme)